MLTIGMIHSINVCAIIIDTTYYLICSEAERVKLARGNHHDRFAGFLMVFQDLTESKTAHFAPFFTFFRLRSTGYAPSKTQKLTKNQLVFANGRES
jgi:hypothetical protein